MKDTYVWGSNSHGELGLGATEETYVSFHFFFKYPSVNYFSIMSLFLGPGSTSYEP